MTSSASQDKLASVLRLLEKAHRIEGYGQQTLDRIVEIAGESLGSAVCTLIQVNLADEYMMLLACWPPDSAFQRYMERRLIRLGNALGPGMVQAAEATESKWLELCCLQEVDQGVIRRDVAARFGFHSLLGCPIKMAGELVGYLNHFSVENRAFSTQEKQLLEMLARRAAAAFESKRREETLNRYEQLSTILQQVDEAHTETDLLEVVLDGALALTGVDRGWISRLSSADHRLNIGSSRGGPCSRSLGYGQGITGLALSQCQVIRAGNVRAPEWSSVYEEFWPDTTSELAVPIFIPNALVRQGHEVILSPKRIGVVNLESRHRAAFSSADEVLLGSLSRHAAVVIDRMGLDRKLAELTRVQQEIIGKEDGDEIIRIVTDAIAKALDYKYVNVSVIRSEIRMIETEHVIGLPQGTPEAFRRLARYHLDRDSDIQCDIVTGRQIEVPETNDPRFDPRIYRAFGQDRLIRVFMPMISASSDRVIGTVEAGSQQAEGQHIYEEDVRILKQFVDYAAEALERKRRGILDEFTHELRAPVVGIRSNISYLERHFDKLDRGFMLRKFGDILADCEIVLYQVKELEYFLGRPPQFPKVERTLVFRDVIIAAIQQLKPDLTVRGFALSKIEYSADDIKRLGVLYVDRTQLKQVVFNLLLNAIKYAEDDPEKFTIRIGIESTHDNFIVSFRDWGIGIQDEYADRVFDPGFRTPEAITRMVSGSGLGLTISRRIMREMGGDLCLIHNSKPIEFHIRLPKYLQEDPNDSIH